MGQFYDSLSLSVLSVRSFSLSLSLSLSLSASASAYAVSLSRVRGLTQAGATEVAVGHFTPVDVERRHWSSGVVVLVALLWAARSSRTEHADDV